MIELTRMANSGETKYGNEKTSASSQRWLDLIASRSTASACHYIASPRTGALKPHDFWSFGLADVANGPQKVSHELHLFYCNRLRNRDPAYSLHIPPAVARKSLLQLVMLFALLLTCHRIHCFTKSFYKVDTTSSLVH
jgi:hypothetical protein